MPRRFHTALMRKLGSPRPGASTGSVYHDDASWSEVGSAVDGVITDNITFLDANGLTHDVSIVDGLTTGWEISGGSPTPSGEPIGLLLVLTGA